MARATKTERVIVEDVTLTLTPREAQFLADVMYHIGGPIGRTSSGWSRRIYQEHITDALQDVGVTADLPTDRSGVIRFDAIQQPQEEK